MDSGTDVDFNRAQVLLDHGGHPAQGVEIPRLGSLKAATRVARSAIIVAAILDADSSQFRFAGTIEYPRFA